VVWAPRLHGEPGGPTSITGTARFVLATFYIASLSFQDTPLTNGFEIAFYVLAALAVTGAVTSALMLEPRPPTPELQLTPIPLKQEEA
jgi:hypothetical protein